MFFYLLLGCGVGKVSSGPATITVDSTPAIMAQPASLSITAGQPAVFSVTATGTAPLEFQWFRASAAVAGATAASYTLPAVAASDSGAAFTVTVSNAAGSVTSNPATLTVNTAPTITAQPASLSITAGQPAVFSVTASGTAPLNYQWFRAGAVITGATNASYTLPAVAASDSGGAFTVTVTNAAGSVSSSPATLTVNSVPTITAQPASVSVTVGQPATFSVIATGTAPLSFQWFRAGASIAGATAASYTLPTTVASDSGAVFTVTISNAAGSVSSRPATLTVNTPPTITGQPTSLSITAGQPAVFSVVVTGTAPLVYQWYRSGSVITGATAASYTLSAVAASDSGAAFTVIISNAAGSLSSSPATLTVNTPPTITAQPASLSVTAGQPASFSVVATSTAPLTYQWYRAGVAVVGATAASYTLIATSASDSGAAFTVTVSNVVSSVTSAPAILTVNTAPTITAQPASVSVTAGQPAVFSVIATGTAPLNYQWFRAGSPIAGATTPSYIVPATLASDSGAAFTVTVSNIAASTTSIPATLTVNTPPTITAQPASLSITAGQSASFSVVASGTAPLSYQWFRAGAAILGATAASYSLPTTSAGDSGAAFTVTISNIAGSVSSNLATLTVNTPPTITTQPVSLSVTAGQPAVFSVAASGTAPLSYQWFRAGAPIAGATAPSYTLSAVAASDSGAAFTVTVSNAAGAATSSPATLTVNASVILSAQALSFVDTDAGAVSSALPIILKNIGLGTALIQSISTTGAFQVDASGCSGTLQPQTQCTLMVSFDPAQTGANQGALLVQTSGPDGSPSAFLSGHGLPAPALAITACQTYVRVNQPCTFSATLGGTPTTHVHWSLSPGSVSQGSIDANGLYSAPSQVPTSGSVTIQAVSTDDTLSSTTLALPIWVAIPQLTGSAPSLLTPGASNVIVLQGTDLENTNQVLVNGASTPFTVLSSTQLQISVPLEPWFTGQVQAVAQIVGPEAGSSSSLALPALAYTVTYDAAVRFSQQAAFGPTPALVSQIQNLGFSAWIDAETQTPPYDYSTSDGAHNGQYYRNTQNSSLALRQRVSLALGQVFVTGESAVCDTVNCGPLWESVIETHAFGNVKDLMTAVALSPIMGGYLNGAESMATFGNIPNQNFGREFMQQMTIGAITLNNDGSQLLSNGLQVPAYTQDNVAAMARALSGWNYPDPSGNFTLPTALTPMVMVDSWHDTGAKTILPGTTLPAGQSGTQDLNSVVNALYNHPNFPPNLSKVLIQHLVKSAPSSDYVSRISAVFMNDGSNQRGNLAAVVKAILLDPEARTGDDPTASDPTGGHLMEPILYLSMVMNAAGGVFTDDQVEGVDISMGQSLYNPPNVFGYYSSSYTLADGTPAPEAQLLDNARAVSKISLLYSAFHANIGLPGTVVQWQNTPFWNRTSPDELLDTVDHFLFHGTMSTSVRGTLNNYISTTPYSSLNDIVPDTVLLAVTTSSYQVIH